MRVRTDQQQAVTGFFATGEGDASVTARAGSGKSTTIADGVAEVPAGTDVLVCAFNKDIADAFKERVHQLRHVTVRTLHSLGRRAIERAHGRVQIDGKRENTLAARIVGEESEPLLEVAELARLAKEVDPDLATDHQRLCEIAMDFGLGGDRDDEAWPLHRRVDVAAEIVTASLQVTDCISYADMLYIPLATRLTPERAHTVAIDESQDMNLAQARLSARAMRPGGRRVYVGDPRQAIYGWRGATSNGMERIAAALKAQRFSLTVTWRCALAIVEEAKAIVPDLRARPGAVDGVVRTARDGELARTAQPGDFVLSRSNAALVQHCSALWRIGTPARIAGADMKGIFDRVRKLARGSVDVVDLVAQTRAWQERETARALAAKRQRRADTVNDQATTILTLAEDVDTVPDLVHKLNRLLADDKAPHVRCSTIHRAKGLETDRVWILKDTLDAMKPRTPADEFEEANLKYVAITRARSELVWVTKENANV